MTDAQREIIALLQQIKAGGGGGGGAVDWGAITGTLSNQTDLQTALDAKAPFPDDTVYGPTWDGSPLAPNQNQLYDKIEAVVASIPTEAQALINAAAPWAGGMKVAGGTQPGVYLDTNDPSEGKPKYLLTGGTSEVIHWDGTQWLILNDGAATIYSSSDDVATPDLVSTWSPADITVTEAHGVNNLSTANKVPRTDARGDFVSSAITDDGSDLQINIGSNFFNVTPGEGGAIILDAVSKVDIKRNGSVILRIDSNGIKFVIPDDTATAGYLFRDSATGAVMVAP